VATIEISFQGWSQSGRFVLVMVSQLLPQHSSLCCLFGVLPSIMLAHNPRALATSILLVSISVATIRLTPPCEFPRRYSANRCRVYVPSSYMQTVAELQPVAELKTVVECQAALKLENVAKYGSIVYELFKGNSFRIGGPRNRNMGA
jgi:hypothetical protein